MSQVDTSNFTDYSTDHVHVHDLMTYRPVVPIDPHDMKVTQQYWLGQQSSSSDKPPDSISSFSLSIKVYPITLYILNFN